MATNMEIHTLHRYFLWAERMREDFQGVTMAARPADLARMSFEQFDERVEQNGAEFWDRVITPMFVQPYMSYYYGGLFVVIEGWRDLKLSDPTIDELLKSTTHVDALRRYRNGSFHFQSAYFNDKFLAVVALGDAPGWIQAVRNGFSVWFLEHFRKVNAGGSG